MILYVYSYTYTRYYNVEKKKHEVLISHAQAKLVKISGFAALNRAAAWTQYKRGSHQRCTSSHILVRIAINAWYHTHIAWFVELTPPPWQPRRQLQQLHSSSMRTIKTPFTRYNHSNKTVPLYTLAGMLVYCTLY